MRVPRTLIVASAAATLAACGSSTPSAVSQAQVQAAAAACSAFRSGVQPAIRTAGNTHDPTPIQRVQKGQPAEGGPVEANAPYVVMLSNVARARFNADYVTLYADIANLTTAIIHVDRNKLDASLSTIRQDGDQIATECKNLGH